MKTVGTLPQSKAGIAGTRRRKHVLPEAPAWSPTKPPPSTSFQQRLIQQTPAANLQVRVIAAIAAALGLLLVSMVGIRLLGSQTVPAEPRAVLSPGDVFILEQSRELEQERTRTKRLREKIDFLLNVDKKHHDLLAGREAKAQELETGLREKSELLARAGAAKEDSVRQLRLTQDQLAEKERSLREKEDLLRETEARLKAYEAAKLASEKRNRELERQLASLKTAARPAETLLGLDWPSMLIDNVAFASAGRELKRILQRAAKESDRDMRALSLREADEIISGLAARLKGYPITDAQANDARFFLSDTLPAQLLALKKQAR